MESKDELNKTDIKNRTRYYFDDLIELEIEIFILVILY